MVAEEVGELNSSAANGEERGPDLLSIVQGIADLLQ